jgi:hypothetical protein
VGAAFHNLKPAAPTVTKRSVLPNQSMTLSEGRQMAAAVSDLLHAIEAYSWQGSSTLSTDAPLEQFVESGESGGISVLAER